MAKLDDAMSTGDVSSIIALQAAIKFNGGGHLNHTLFWDNLTPEKQVPSASMSAAITKSFGTYENMKDTLSAKAVGVQGSGWGWLAYNKATGTFHFISFSMHGFFFVYEKSAFSIAVFSNLRNDYHFFFSNLYLQAILTSQLVPTKILY